MGSTAASEYLKGDLQSHTKELQINKEARGDILFHFPVQKHLTYPDFSNFTN
jgi:hypothetical protein